MRSAVITTGRRVLVVLEPGDEVLSTLTRACLEHGIAQAVIGTFSGALRRARLIASEWPAADPEAPLAESIEVTYTEGIGSGTITTGADGTVVAHVHVALGDKARGAAAVAGHLLEGETHYVIEVVLDEVLTPALGRSPHPDSRGVPILTIQD
ncbi:PPC domain-containing DNA-binding protein [Microbacterium sp. NPDC091313]